MVYVMYNVRVNMTSIFTNLNLVTKIIYIEYIDLFVYFIKK